MSGVPRSHLPLALMMVAVVSCGGRTTGIPAPPEDSGSLTTESDASAGGADATASNTGDAGLTCTNPIHVPIGKTLNGSTCGGPLLPSYGCGDQRPHPAVYFVVDAPDAAPFHILLSTGPSPSMPESLSVYAYDSCGSAGVACTSGASLSSVNGGVLWAVDRWDVPCGDFTISVASGGQ